MSWVACRDAAVTTPGNHPPTTCCGAVGWVPGRAKGYINPRTPCVPMVMSTPDNNDVKPAMRAVFGKTTQTPLQRLFADRPTDGGDQ